MSADDGASEARPLLLVVGSSYAAFREYTFRSVAAEYRLWLLNPAVPTWELPYLVAHTVVDCMDAEAIVAAARQIQREHEIAGVFCYDEAYIEPAAHASAALGFHTLDPAAVARCRDKSTTRDIVRGLGLPQPESIPVSTVDEAAVAAAKIGYPVILKPRNLGASLGVVKVDRAEDLAARYALTVGVTVPGVREFPDAVLVEEFVEGPEISVDCVLFEGHCTPVVVAHKLLGTVPGFEFEEIGHDFLAGDPLLDDPGFAAELTRLHAALGIRYGVTHTEFKLTPRGRVLVEVNARMGGGLIPHVGHLVNGYDIALAAARVCAGTEPGLRRAAELMAAAIRFVFPAYPMTVTDIEVRDDLIRPPIVEVGVAAAPGMRLRLPPLGMSHSAYLIAVAETLAPARAALADVSAIVQIHGDPLEVTTG